MPDRPGWTCVPPSRVLLPAIFPSMASSLEAALEAKYDVGKHRVISSTHISDRTAGIVARLTSESPPGEKPAVVCLTAQAKVASKLISVIEITKRELASRGLKCYQYNAMSSQLMDVPRSTRKPAKAAGESDSEDAFETMGASEPETKKRNVPLMTVYLSRMSIKELRTEYGLVLREALFERESWTDKAIGSRRQGDGA